MARMREKDDRALKLLFIMLAVDNGSFLNVKYVSESLLHFKQKFGYEKVCKKFAEYHEEFKVRDEFRLTGLAWNSVFVSEGVPHDEDRVAEDVKRWEDATDPSHPDFDPKGGLID